MLEFYLNKIYQNQTFKIPCATGDMKHLVKLYGKRKYLLYNLQDVRL